MSPLEYEYWTWDKELPKNAETATVKMATPSQLNGLTEAQAKIHFWQITQAELVPYIQKHILIDKWEPISEVGPAALKITTYNQTGGFGRLLSQIIERQWAFLGWTIKFRRVKGTGQYPMWAVIQVFGGYEG